MCWKRFKPVLQDVGYVYRFCRLIISLK